MTLWREGNRHLGGTEGQLLAESPCAAVLFSTSKLVPCYKADCLRRVRSHASGRRRHPVSKRYDRFAGRRRLLGAGMGAVVDLLELGGGELSVALRGGEAFVAEEFLDGAEIGSLFKQMSAEGVAQSVRMYV